MSNFNFFVFCNIFVIYFFLIAFSNGTIPLDLEEELIKGENRKFEIYLLIHFSSVNASL